MRYTARVDFAVGLDALEAGAKDLLDDEFDGDAVVDEINGVIRPGESLDEAIDRFLGSLTRKAVDRAVRDGFTRGGYQWIETLDSLINQDLMAVAGQGPARRVAALFPELVS